MDWKLELVVIPVTDVDRAKKFYSEQLGFVVDHDTRAGDSMRVIQLTPPGSACSIAIGSGLSDAPPGCVKGIQLVVSDIDAARAELVERGVSVSPVRHFDGTDMVEGRGGDWNSFVFFADPDGNGWALQERPSEAPEASEAREASEAADAGEAPDQPGEAEKEQPGDKDS